jgi:hypothetical protein
MKILEFKRSGIGLIVEFRGIPRGFPDQGRNMEWFDYSIPLCPPGGLNSNKFDAMEDMFHIQVKDELFDEDQLKSLATESLDAKYEKTDVVEVMKGLTHLNAHKKSDLL